jgi:hypothetical protein
MKDNYASQYFSAINNALNDSAYKLDSNEVDKEVFFQGINAKLKSINKEGGRIFFLGNGASAAL